MEDKKSLRFIMYACILSNVLTAYQPALLLLTIPYLIIMFSMYHHKKVTEAKEKETDNEKGE